MTDAEIIKALECCIPSYHKKCDNCAYSKNKSHGLSVRVCSEDMRQDALDLINRQKAEIERLETEYESVYEQARADILGNMADGGTSCHWCIEQHKAEAIKEFAKKVKELFADGDEVIDEIDNIVKEMVGEME
jgi:cell division septum initiation protein DivIVA